MKTVNDFSLQALKEKCKFYGMATAGTKAELFGRLMEKLPTGEWMQDDEERDDEIFITGENVEASIAPPSETIAMQHDQRELYLAKKQAELAERELALARREIEQLREVRRRSFDEEGQSPRMSTTSGLTDRSEMNITAIASLLDCFHGSSDSYEKWERQVRLLKTMYKLDDNGAKILMGLRLKEKANEWFHSKPELIEMDFENFLSQLRAMFFHRPSKLVRRKKFEERVWKKGELFSEYFHEKTILANRVPVDADEIVDYLIEGIPDASLRDQARIQKFDAPISLLDAFGKITLRRAEGSAAPGDDDKRRFLRSGEEKSVVATRRDTGGRRCHSCGSATHLAADCPTKDRGMKCFECREYGHLASRCPKKQTSPKNACSVTKSADGRYYKEILINGFDVTALVDTGSDLSLMRADKYIKIGAPSLQSGEVRFRGVGSDTNTTFGAFHANVCIDENIFPIVVNVVSGDLMRHELLIGTDFLDTVELTVKGGKISILPIDDTTRGFIPEILSVDYDCQANEIDASYVTSEGHRREVEKIVETYEPVKSREMGVEMNIIVKDNQPVYQRARRLSPSERNERRVDYLGHIIENGSIRPPERKTELYTDEFSRNPLPHVFAIDEGEEKLIVRSEKAQREDSKLKRTIDLAEHRSIDGYVVRDGFLSREADHGAQLVVPKSMQPQAVRRAHERGHFLVNKTETLVKKDFPNMRAKVERAKCNCINCILAERKQSKQTSASADHMKPWPDEYDDDSD